MRFLRWYFQPLSQLPELSGLEQSQQKLIVRSCRWKILLHWQFWLSVILGFPISLAVGAVFALWYMNLSLGMMNHTVIDVAALASAASILFVGYLSQKVRVYCLAPHYIEAVHGVDFSSADRTDHELNQKARLKSIKTSLLWTFALLLVACVSAAFAFQTAGFNSPLKMPQALEKPRIVRNELGVVKTKMMENPSIGVVTDIVPQKSSSSEAGGMVLAGTTGALFLHDGAAARLVAFEKRQDHVDLVKLDSTGAVGFMNRGAWCSEGRVLDGTGKRLWGYGAGLTGVDDMACGDLDGDGNPEFAVGFNGGGGIHLLTHKGARLWQYPDGNVWHVEMADLNGDGRKKIVHSNAGGEITVRDRQGKVLSKSRPKPYFSHFSLIRWPDPKSPERLLLAEDDAIWILDPAATVLAKFAAPDAGTLGEGRATVATLSRGSVVLATVVAYGNFDRSIFYIHDLKGKLLYEEVLPESCPSIAVVQTGEVGRDAIAIGCSGKVLQYQ